MKEILNRLKAETPLFFKRLRNLAISFGTCCYAAYSISPAVGFDNTYILSLLKYSIVACAFVAGTAQLSKIN